MADGVAPSAEGAADPSEGLMVHAVTAGYGPREILHDVTLRAPKGEITGLIGPNGSGKTTLVRVASRGLAPTSGRVRILGRDPYSMPARRAARLVAVVPQELTPAFSYSVLEMVLMGRSPYRSPWGGGGVEDWTRARSAMAAAGVHHLADRPIEELSGGERQRVVLAQALAQDAPVLLLDEPTIHLDVRHVLDTLTLVRDLARRDGKAVLAIFHDLNLASAYCDRIYALKEGHVVAQGPPAEVIEPAMVSTVFGVDAWVVPAAADGRPAVVLAPAPRPPGRGGGGARAHVIGGGGRGASTMRALVELGFDVTAGVLHAGDTDDSVAERLTLRRVTVPPFSHVDDASAEECLDLALGADLLVVCDAPFGPANMRNLRIAGAAAAAGVRIYLVGDVPVEDRDFTEGQATELWRALEPGATSARTVPELLGLIQRSG